MRLFSCRVRPLSWPVTVGALAVASFLQPLQAQAGAFGLYDHSATSEALSLAGAAAGAAGLGSMYFNPATVTQFQGIQASFNLSFIAPEVQHTDLTNSSPGLFLALAVQEKAATIPSMLCFRRPLPPIRSMIGSGWG
jgi:long-subunit fatty acid transport protein